MPAIPRTLFTVYSDFHRFYQALLNRTLAPYGLFSTQWVVLKYLYFAERQTLVNLARAHGVEAPSMTGTVKKLSALGYAESAPGEDRRHKVITLTDKGRQVYEESQAIIDGLLAKIQQNSTEVAIEEAITLFDMMKVNIMKLL